MMEWDDNWVLTDCEWAGMERMGFIVITAAPANENDFFECEIKLKDLKWKKVV